MKYPDCITLKLNSSAKVVENKIERETIKMGLNK